MKIVPISTIPLSVFLLFLFLANCDYMNPSSGFNNEDYTILKNFNTDTLPLVTLDLLDSVFDVNTKSTSAFRLIVENSRTFYIEATATTSGCCGFSILDSAFKPVYTRSYIYSSDPTEITYLSSGKYFLLLKNYCSSVYASVSLHVDLSEPDNTRATARMVEVNGDSLTGTIGTKDIDMFKFAAQKDSCYTIITKNSPNTNLRLFRPDSSQYGFASSSNGSSTMSFRCKVPGTYYFTVVNNYTSSDQKIEYSCSVITQPFDSFEPDDSIYQAKILPNDGKLQPHTIFAGDVDWMKCSIPSGYYYLIKSNNNSYAAYIYTHNMSFLTNLSPNDSFFLWGATPADSAIFIKAGFELTNDYYGSMPLDSYTISVTGFPIDQFEPDDNPANAHLIKVGNDAFKSALIKSDIDWIKFAVKTGVTYDVLGTGNSSSVIGMYKSSGLTYISSRSFGSHIAYTASSDDTVYLKIGERSGTTINTFKPSQSTKSPVFEYSIKINTIENDTFEYDNSLKYAKSINSNGSIQKRICTLNDTDVIKFNAIADSSYLISVSNAKRINLYSDSGAVLRTQYNSSNTSMGLSLNWMCTRSGTYYFDITNPYVVDSLMLHYTVSVKTFKIDSFEPDNIQSIATLLDTSKTPPTHTLIQNDVDWFKYNVTPGMILKITCSGPSYLPLLSSNGMNEVLFQGDTFPVFLYAQDTIPNIFYMRIGPLQEKFINSHQTDPLTYQYALKIVPVYNDAYEPDNSLNTASTIKLNEPAQSRILLFKETDYIKMNAVKDSSYKINFNGILKMSFIHSSGTVLHNRTWSDAGSINSFNWTCQESGAYYIKIDSTSQKWNIRDSLKINYKVSFVSAHGDNYEPDNTPETARLINIDTVRQHHTLFVMDEDWMKFTGVKGTGYQFFCEQQMYLSPYVAMSLYHSDGKTLYQNSMSSGTKWNCPADGDYLLKFCVDFKAAVNSSEWEYSTYLQKTSLP